MRFSSMRFSSTRFRTGGSEQDEVEEPYPGLESLDQRSYVSLAKDCHHDSRQALHSTEFNHQLSPAARRPPLIEGGGSMSWDALNFESGKINTCKFNK